MTSIVIFGAAASSSISCFVVIKLLLAFSDEKSRISEETGYPPFAGENDDIVLKKIKKLDYNFDGPNWKMVSPEAIDLIQKMLASRDKRISALDAMNHPWMTTNLKASKLEMPNISGLANFLFGEKLKKFTLSLLASQSSEVELIKLSRLFLKIDSDNDGQITYKEFKEVLESLGHLKELEELSDLIKRGNIDQHTKFNYNGTPPPSIPE